MKLKLALAIIATCGILSAQAQVNERQKNQKERTQQGVESGELTKREAKKIKQQQENVKDYEAKLRSDGELSDKDKAKLNVAQNQASKSIYRKKHNKRDRND
ncbi:MAG: hypothetical protein U0Y10_22540 [Spirosomataceae bacterium]